MLAVGGPRGLLALRLAARELRAGTRGLRVVLACLALGVASIAAVGGLRDAVLDSLADQGQAMLGGDVAVDGGSQPLPEALSALLLARGARLSEVVRMRSLLVAPGGDRLLVELEAVDAAYPLSGAAGLRPAMPVQAALAGGGIVAEPLVLDRLGVKPGAVLRLGSADVTLRAALEEQPDGAAGGMLFGPHVLLSLASLPATGLVQPGSLLTHELRAVLPPGADLDATEQAIRDAFPGTGWRIRDARDATPGIARFVDQTGRFMTLVGLTALLVGGIGVGTGVRAWLEARARGIAVLRCLGAPSRLVLGSALLQVMALCGVGVLAGVLAGAALPPLGLWLLGGLLPVPVRAGVYPGALALAAVFGLLTALCFALWPLGLAARVPGAALFRGAQEGSVLAAEGARPAAWVVALNALCAAALVGLTVLAAPQRGLALWFCAGAAGTLVLFRLGAEALVRLARLSPVPPSRRAPPAWARLGLSNLHRPGAPTRLMMTALGIGLSTLAAVALIEANIRSAVLEQLPRDAPAFFFIDVQPDQLARFDGIVQGSPGFQSMDQVPSLRARLVAVDGVPAAEVQATPQTRWALRGDRGLTIAATPPGGTRLVAGEWWPADYDGPPLVSFDAGLARGWGVRVGSVLRVNVLGRDIDLRVASLRDIDWRALGLNFALVVSPGLLSHAPHGDIAAVRTRADVRGQAALLRAVTDALPNVTGIRVADVLAAVATLVGQIAAALAATGSLALLSGALVLAGAVAAGQRRRMAEAVVLKSLGATRGQIRAAWLVEFGLVGLAAGLVAAAVGTAASWAVVRFLLDGEWVFLPGVLAATVLGCVALMLLFGFAGTAAALRARAAPFLRNE